MGTAMPVPHHPRVPRLLALGIAALAVVSSGCTSPAEDASDDPASDRPPLVLPFGADGEWAAEPGSAMPSLAPTGTPYRTCITDYRSIDWTAAAAEVVEAHRAAATAPCTDDDWYRDTAFQNGILTFMLLVGEEELSAAGADGDEPADLAASLSAQGFERLASLEIASSGWCHRGEVQVALATLSSAGSTSAAGSTSSAGSAGRAVQAPGLDAIVAKAEAAGAVVDRGPALTVLTGGDVACATGIVHADDVVGWVTASDGATVRAAVARLVLS